MIPILQDYLAHRMDHPKGMPIDLDCRWLIPTCSRKSPWTGGYTGSKPLDRVKAIGKRAGIDHNVTIHMLRRSCATHLEAAGVPRSLISRILRHSGEAVTERFYLRSDEEAMILAVKDVTF